MSKDDELDALLKLNTTKTKKSNPVVYNFSEPIENLHLGLSSSGKDFSRTTTTTNNTAKKGNSKYHFGWNSLTYLIKEKTKSKF